MFPIDQSKQKRFAMDNRPKRDDMGTLYNDQREHDESEQGLEIEEVEEVEEVEEIEEVEEVEEVEESRGLLYYLRMAVIGVIVVFGILVALFFGFILLGIIGITIFLVALFFGFLFLLGFLRR